MFDARRRATNRGDVLNKKALTTWYITFDQAAGRNWRHRPTCQPPDQESNASLHKRPYAHTIVSAPPIRNIRVRLRVPRERTRLGLPESACQQQDLGTTSCRSLQTGRRFPRPASTIPGCTNQRCPVVAGFEACCGPQACCRGLDSLVVLSPLLAFLTRTGVSSKLPSAFVGCGSSHVSRVAARLAIGSVGHNAVW
jgi:hypothetical protein